VRRAKGGDEARLLAITGLSGSGKTHVLRALEDVGWFCVDNLPTALLPRFAELVAASPELSRAALVVDVREPGFLREFPRVYRQVRARRGLLTTLLFLEAEEKVLQRRFSETRRPHPFAFNQPALDGVRQERTALAPIRKMADACLDTSGYTVHQLRDYVQEHFDLRSKATPLLVQVLSFGFKHGVPAEADLLFDVRFLPNPNFVASLKRLTGEDAAVVRFLKRQPDTGALLRRLEVFLGFLLPRYVQEGKSYLTIAVGCTGGRHRSVMVAEALGRSLARRGWSVRIRHRDVRET